MRKLQVLLVLLLLLSGCGNKVKEKVIFETNVEYVDKFVEAINTQDKDLLYKLVSEEAKIYYDENYAEVDLGDVYDESSHLNYLLSINTRFEDNRVVDGASDYLKVLETLHTNHIYEDIYGITNKNEYSYYEFVIEDHEIVYIYVYCNDEERLINERMNEGQIGIEYSISPDNSYLIITHVFEGSVAYTLDLVEGDKIYAINDVPVTSFNPNYDEASLRLNGEADTQVKLSIERSNKELKQDVYLTRQKFSDYQFAEEYIEMDYTDYPE